MGHDRLRRNRGVFSPNEVAFHQIDDDYYPNDIGTREQALIPRDRVARCLWAQLPRKVNTFGNPSVATTNVLSTKPDFTLQNTLLKNLNVIEKFKQHLS
jgi:hypothetical protein